MKKLTFLVLMIASCVMLNAVGMDVFAGIGLSSMTGDVSDDLSTKFSWSLGASLELPIGTNLALEPGVRFFSGGAFLELKEYGLKYEETHTLNYLDIFAKAKYKISDLQPYFGVGLAFLTSADGEAKISAGGYSESETRDLKDMYASVNFNIMLGVDYILMDKFIIGVEYSRSLNNIYDLDIDHEDWDPFDDTTVHLNNFMFKVGYRLGI